MSEQPSFQLVVPTNTAAAFPASTTTNVLASTIATSTLATSGIVLDRMVCLTTAAGGTVAVSDALATAATTFTITTVNPVAGSFIELGIRFPQGLKVVTGAAAGGWLFIYRLG